MTEHTQITEPSAGYFQVRIKRGGVEYRGNFSALQWRSRKRALNAACHWRDQMQTALGAPARIRNARSGQPRGQPYSTDMHGVSRSVYYDRRRDMSYLRYLVCWHDGERARVKSFQVGDVELCSTEADQHAFRTAVAFRAEFEACVRVGRPFDPRGYRHWRADRLYNA